MCVVLNTVFVYFCFGGVFKGGGSPGETPRRSARLNSKGRFSTDSIEGDAEEDAELIATKRSKHQSRENGKDVSSPKTPAKVDGEQIHLPIFSRWRDSKINYIHPMSRGETNLLDDLATIWEDSLFMHGLENKLDH